MREKRDLRLAELARRQHGVVSTRQLNAIGIDSNGIGRRLAAGRLHRVFPGAYAVGHAALTREGWFKAATLSIGDCCISHFSAGQLQGIWKYRVAEIHVTTTRRVRPRRGIVVHRVARGVPYWVRDGIPVTTPERTVLDLATVVRSDRAYVRVVREAQVQELASHERLLRLCEECTSVPGVRRLREVLAGGSAPTRSTLEDDALEVLRRFGLTDPLINHEIDGIEVDIYDPERRLVVEIDSRRYHDNPLARADDARKQARLEARGVTVARLREEQVDGARRSPRGRGRPRHPAR